MARDSRYRPTLPNETITPAMIEAGVDAILNGSWYDPDGEPTGERVARIYRAMRAAAPNSKETKPGCDSTPLPGSL